MVMDRAYEGDATRQLASGLGYSVVVPPRKSRKVAWEYDEELYKRRNEVERLFRRMKGFRRIFTRYDKLDELYIGFILFGTIFDALRSVNRPKNGGANPRPSRHWSLLILLGSCRSACRSQYSAYFRSGQFGQSAFRRA